MVEVTVTINNKLPRLYGAIVLIFPRENFCFTVLELLPGNVGCVEYADFIEITYREVDNVFSWEIDDLLTRLFSECNVELLCDLISRYEVKVLVDVSFHHHSKFPALVFEGSNMRIIHKLQANISIDPY